MTAPTIRDLAARPVMTRAELAQHAVRSHGRDYSQSDDGWSDMDVAAHSKWRAVAGWGRDGWDLGDWPYVVVSVREHDSRECDPICAHAGDTGTDFCRRFEMRQTVEGDTDVYAFETEADRNAAIDYLFVWYGIGRDYDEWATAGLTSREALDAGTLRIPAEFRGPFSWARCDAEKGAES